MTLPTFKPATAVSVTAATRKIGVMGIQSNGVGTGDPFTLQNLPYPLYQLTPGEYVPQASIWTRLGSMFRNQIAANSPQKKFGCLTQCAIDLAAAGKAPIAISCAKGGTPISYFLSGIGQTEINTFAAEVVASPAGSANWHIVVSGGENDANTLATSLAWQASLTTHVDNNIRAYLPSARIYVMQLNAAYAAPDTTWRDNVRAANIAFVAADGNAELLDCDAFAYASPHYTAAGYNSIGSLFASRVLVNQP